MEAGERTIAREGSHRVSQTQRDRKLEAWRRYFCVLVTIRAREICNRERGSAKADK